MPGLRVLAETLSTSRNCLIPLSNRNAVHKQKPPGTGKVPGGESCQPLGVIKGL
jgi:hypothetical protein